MNLTHTIETEGYLAVFVAVGLECVGVPFPGETTVIAAGVYAGTTHHLSPVGIVAVAAAAAVIGGTIGYLVGRLAGSRLLRTHGHRIGLTPVRLQLLDSLFERRGWLVVAGGRFATLLRTYAPVLAGASRMPLLPFALANLFGALAWAALFGFGSYALGNTVKTVGTDLGIGVGILTAILIVVGIVVLRRATSRAEQRASDALAASSPPEESEAP